MSSPADVEKKHNHGYHHHGHSGAGTSGASGGQQNKKPKIEGASAGPTLKATGIAGAPNDTGVGRHLGTQILYAVGYLKEHPNNPIRLEELAAFSRVNELQHNSELLAAFRAHDKVNYDEKLDLYSYKPDFSIRNNDELLALLRRRSPRGGMLVKQLQESWPNAKQAIEELEKEGKVLVIRAGGGDSKEGQMRVVFWNEIGDMPQIDQEFKDMWHRLKLPDATQIAKELEDAGMKATSTIASDLPPPTDGKKKGKGKQGAGNRRIKLQNTHLKELGIDLSKDFVKPGAPGASTGRAGKKM